MSQPITIGIIGAGRIGKIHAENIAYFMPNAKLAAIADVNMTSAIEAWAKNFGRPEGAPGSCGFDRRQGN